jgi:hypothetical protein
VLILLASVDMYKLKNLSMTLIFCLTCGCSLQRASDYLFQFQEEKVNHRIEEKMISFNLVLSRVEIPETRIFLNLEKQYEARVILFDLKGAPVKQFTPELAAQGIPSNEIKCTATDDEGVAQCTFKITSVGKKVFFLRNANISSAPIMNVEDPTVLSFHSGRITTIPPEIVPLEYQDCNAQLGTMAATKIACWGWWDSGSCAGDDTRMCGGFDRKGGPGETGCVIPASKCISGKAKAITAKSMRKLSNCLITVWEYACL